MTRVGEEMAEWAGGPVLEATAFYSKAHPGVAGSLAQEIPRPGSAQPQAYSACLKQALDVKFLPHAFTSGSEQRHTEYDPGTYQMFQTVT